MEEGGAIRAFSGVHRRVSHSAVGRVRSLAKIHNMDSEEVRQVERLGDIRGGIVDQIIYVFLKVVDQIIEEPSIPIRGIEKGGVAYPGYIQLFFVSRDSSRA